MTKLHAATTDMALGIGGMSTPFWMQVVHSVNESAAVVAAIGGAFIVLIRLYFSILQFIEYKKYGKKPKN